MSNIEPTANTEITSVNHYDNTPYVSYPYSLTKPENIKAIAHIFGLQTPDLETARVLELGCASGGNIIPHAVHYPKAKFVGIDFSKVQVAAGQKQIDALGLKNIELKTLSITDIDKSLGEFDYIICHGVLSWVPENVRDAIFRISNENLSANGAAYISYNTLPGWNMVRSIRDMMLFHARNFKEIPEQVHQSRLLLNFIKDTLAESKSPYGEMLSHEAQLLSAVQDDYLRHDHMEEINHQYYFHEFMKEASKNGLQYLGDAQVASMYSGNFSPKVAEKLKEVQDIVRSEQYMDFLMNRRFRSTILTKKNIQLNRNVNLHSTEGIYFRMNITPEKLLSDVTLDNDETLDFYYNNNQANKLNTNSPILKAMLYVFHANPNFALNSEEITGKIQELLTKDKYSKELVKNEVMTNITRLVFTGYIIASGRKPNFSQKPSDKPKASSMVHVQLEAKQNWVTNELHDKVGISVIDFYILKYLDGNNSKENILDKLVEHTINAELKINQDGKDLTDPKEIREVMKKYLDNCLTAYATNALLIA